MTTSAQDLKEIIAADSSLALEFGTDLFIGLMPDSPDSCVSLVDAPGMPPSPGPYYSSFVHALVRGGVGGYSTAAALAQSVGDTLHEYTGTPSGSSYYYTGVWMAGEPSFIGVDEKNRPLFSINFRVQRR